MNEKIKELAQQSVYYDEDEESWEFDRKKFAELIVKECADIALWEQSKGYDVGEKIKEHFGVK